ncbi:MAG: ParA family protein, partial [Alphaproteobacteria bacterium]
MGHSIAVMITKGGVGKSTLIMALADTLSVYHGKRVLIIDSDTQASISSMLMDNDQLVAVQKSGRTIAEFLKETTVNGKQLDWHDFVVEGVSDVDDARTVSLIPCTSRLLLFEREIITGLYYSRLEPVINGLLRSAEQEYDFVFVDCPPTFSLLTEAWMRRCEFYLSPAKPDYLSLRGLEVLQQFKSMDSSKPFARNLGVLVNMKDPGSQIDIRLHNALRENSIYRCFAHAVPSHPYLRHAAIFDPGQRSYMAKYPGAVATALKEVAQELLGRIRNHALEPKAPPVRP